MSEPTVQTQTLREGAGKEAPERTAKIIREYYRKNTEKEGIELRPWEEIEGEGDD